MLAVRQHLVQLDAEPELLVLAEAGEELISDNLRLVLSICYLRFVRGD